MSILPSLSVSTVCERCCHHPSNTSSTRAASSPSARTRGSRPQRDARAAKSSSSRQPSPFTSKALNMSCSLVR